MGPFYLKPLLVPTLRVGTQVPTLRVEDSQALSSILDAERRSVCSHGERGNKKYNKSRTRRAHSRQYHLDHGTEAV